MERAHITSLGLLRMETTQAMGEKKHMILIPSDTRNFPEGVIIDKSLKKLTCTNFFLGKKNYVVALRRRASPI